MSDTHTRKHTQDALLSGKKKKNANLSVQLSYGSRDQSHALTQSELVHAHTAQVLTAFGCHDRSHWFLSASVCILWTYSRHTAVSGLAT